MRDTRARLLREGEEDEADEELEDERDQYLDVGESSPNYKNNFFPSSPSLSFATHLAQQLHRDWQAVGACS